jgi:hypothetical protein
MPLETVTQLRLLPSLPVVLLVALSGLAAAKSPEKPQKLPREAPAATAPPAVGTTPQAETAPMTEPPPSAETAPAERPLPSAETPLADQPPSNAETALAPEPAPSVDHSPPILAAPAPAALPMAPLTGPGTRPPPVPPSPAPTQRPAYPVQPATAPLPGQLDGLSAWVGCAPSCPGVAARAGMRLRSSFILAFPPLRAMLDPMLGRRAMADLARIAETGPPVERRGDWLRIALCRQDACATSFIVLFVQPAAGEVLLCWHEERWEPQRLRWADNRGGVWRTGAPGPQPLPEEGCNNRGPLGGHDWDLLQRLADG